MTCPFLRETQVKSCSSASIRKLIPLAQAGGKDEKCSSAAHTTCSVYRNELTGPETGGPCPFLRESLMQYCAAAPVTRFVPYSESLLSRCGTDSFRYCDLYLSMAHPDLSREEVDGLPLPGWLSYSANHMWLEVTEDGICHAGIDAFLARVLGKIERLSYVWEKGRHCPTAVLTAAGQDFEATFPNPMLLTNCNLYLRANPSRLISEPYTAAWLFEGMPLPETRNHLRSGVAARQWMEREQRRINEFLQQPADGSQPCAADGGQFAEGLAAHVPPERLRALFHEFFSPFASEKSQL
jgi:glycine cleavage system H lipoate-binding protein